MDSRVSLWLDRASNELSAAQALHRISQDAVLKKELVLPAPTTFYSSVIGHAYYAIFYAARAALLTQKVEIRPPDIHNKVYNQFRQAFFDTGKLDKHLLTSYTSVLVRAADLLNVMKVEKKKRGDFIYETAPQANKDPAEDSLTNANLFISHIRTFIREQSG